MRKRVAEGPVADYLSTPLPDPRSPWRNVTFVALDIETTGLDAQRDAMLSVGWVEITGGRIELRSAQSWLVKPDAEVGQSAAVHGLTDSVVKEGLPLSVVLLKILAALKGRVLLVHYAGLDRELIDRLCREAYGVALPLFVVDTLALEIRRQRARHHTAPNQQLRLAQLRQQYHLPAYDAHNCLTDAIATAELLLAMAAHREGKSPVLLQDLLT